MLSKIVHNLKLINFYRIQYFINPSNFVSRVGNLPWIHNQECIIGIYLFIYYSCLYRYPSLPVGVVNGWSSVYNSNTHKKFSHKYNYTLSKESLTKNGMDFKMWSPTIVHTTTLKNESMDSFSVFHTEQYSI